MKRIILFCLALATAHAVQANVVDFDNLPPITNVLPHYNGFIWGLNVGNPALFTVDDTTYTSVGNYGNSYNSPSGNNAVSNYGYVNISLSSGLAFDFNGAYFSPWTAYDAYQSTTATKLTVAGYNGANLVGSVSMNFTGIGYSWLQADLLGITRLMIIGSDPYALVLPRVFENTSWLMDDFTYNQTVNPVAEPADIWLTGAGLLALFGARKKFNFTLS